MMAVFLGVLLLGETGYLLFVAVKGTEQTGILVGLKGPCTASDKPGKHIVSGFWLAPVAFDLICSFLTVWKVCLPVISPAY